MPLPAAAQTTAETAPDDTVYTVAVRELCAFAAKQGDLDLRFTPAPTAQEGIAGHQTVAARRGAGYAKEVAVAGAHGPLRLRGRADGFDLTARRVEEVKTYKGDLARVPDNHRALHRAQAMVYGWLLCEAFELPALDVAVVYFDIGSQQETPMVEHHSAEALRSFAHGLCERFLQWARQELAHRQARDQALRPLRFPHGDFRTGQRDLAEAVWRAARQRRCLLAQAPTGIGKTLGTLFPLLKALPAGPAAPAAVGAAEPHSAEAAQAGTADTATAPAQAPRLHPGLDKVFFLSAKTPGRAVALEGLALLRSGPRSADNAASQLPLRVLEMVARDKACAHPDKACHGDSCPLARGFYDRLPGARGEAVAACGGPPVCAATATPLAAVVAEGVAAVPDAAAEAGASSGWWSRDAVQQLARQHQVCPYYLSQELVRWADVVVADYNYYFDTSALLHSLTEANGWRVALLVDEAHNLVDRARSMYSTSLVHDQLRTAKRQAPAELKKPLQRWHRAWQNTVQTLAADYTVCALPEKFLQAVQEACTALTEFYATHPTWVDADLQALYFDALGFVKLAEGFGDHALFDIERAPQPGPRGQFNTTLTLRNVVPAPYLAPRFAAAHCSVLFSGTLMPADFYTQLLGLPEQRAWLEVQAPFQAAQLQVQLATHISTRFADRTRSVPPIVALMARQFAATPGNYLAFFSSFDYLTQVEAAFAAAHPGVPRWVQHRGMGEAAREAFVARFVDGGQGIGFAVLGGAFGEGVDLPGQRLIGAFIATLGLPQLNPLNEEMRARMQALFGQGYDYTYLVPGLRKVVQAAGRVIRTVHDQGVVVLIDDRFRRPEVQRLLPAWWGPPQRLLPGP